MPPTVILLNGPVGVGKSTLGQALAQALGGCFLDSDDRRPPGIGWLAAVLTTARAVVRDSLAALQHTGLVVVAQPLRARDWAFFQAHFRRAGVATHCVTLAADADAILRRARRLSPAEAARMRTMLAEGYANRPFSALTVQTDAAGFDATAAVLVQGCRTLLAA